MSHKEFDPYGQSATDKQRLKAAADGLEQSIRALQQVKACLVSLKEGHPAVTSLKTIDTQMMDLKAQLVSEVAGLERAAVPQVQA